jgi:hypothetical protein
MKPAVAALCVSLAVGLLVGCNDSEPGFPVGDGGWQLFLKIGEYPDVSVEYPIVIDLESHLLNLETGEDAPDGTLIVFRTSIGTFPNGQSEIELPTAEGCTTTMLNATRPGRYEITVEYPQGDASTTTTINVDL